MKELFARSVVVLAILSVAPRVRAREKYRLELKGGFALSSSNGHTKATGQGGFGQVELASQRWRWIQPRLYSGMVFTSPKHDCPAALTPCNVSAELFYAGAKLRLMPPIPWVAPFAELGLGLSFGKLETRVGTEENQDSVGLFLHLPVSVGLAIGPAHQFVIEIPLLIHGSQLIGGIGLGFGFDFGAELIAPPPPPPPEPIHQPTAKSLDRYDPSIKGACRTDADCPKSQHCYTGTTNNGLCLPNH